MSTAPRQPFIERALRAQAWSRSRELQASAKREGRVSVVDSSSEEDDGPRSTSLGSSSLSLERGRRPTKRSPSRSPLSASPPPSRPIDNGGIAQLASLQHQLDELKHQYPHITAAIRRRQAQERANSIVHPPASPAVHRATRVDDGIESVRSSRRRRAGSVDARVSSLGAFGGASGGDVAGYREPGRAGSVSSLSLELQRLHGQVEKLQVRVRARFSELDKCPPPPPPYTHCRTHTLAHSTPPLVTAERAAGGAIELGASGGVAAGSPAKGAAAR
jgi:hypothetical protein